MDIPTAISRCSLVLAMLAVAAPASAQLIPCGGSNEHLVGLAMDPDGTSNLACGLRADGTAACWGSAEPAETVDQQRAEHPTPIAVEGVTDAVEISAGRFAACVRNRDGTVACWATMRRNEDGADATRSAAPHAVTIEGVSGVRSIAVGDDHACLLFPDGSVRCWGSNDEGQAGTAATLGARVPTPTVVRGLPPVVGIAARGNASCAWTDTGQLYFWGAFGWAPAPIGPAPRRVDGIPAVASVAIGSGRACARGRDGSVFCWENGGGLVAPARIVVRRENVNATDLAVVRDAPCYVGPTGHVSSLEQLDDDPTLVEIQNVEHATLVRVHGNDACVLVEGGAVSCWHGIGHQLIEADRQLECRPQSIESDVARDAETPAPRAAPEPTPMQAGWVVWDDYLVVSAAAAYFGFALSALVPDAGLEFRLTPTGTVVGETLMWSVHVPLVRPYLGSDGNDKWGSAALVTPHTRATRRWPIGTTYLVLEGGVAYLPNAPPADRFRGGVRQTIEIAGPVTAIVGTSIVHASPNDRIGASFEVGLQLHPNIDLPRPAFNLILRVDDYPADANPVVLGASIGFTGL